MYCAHQMWIDCVRCSSILTITSEATTRADSLIAIKKRGWQQQSLVSKMSVQTEQEIRHLLSEQGLINLNALSLTTRIMCHIVSFKPMLSQEFFCDNHACLLLDT